MPADAAPPLIAPQHLRGKDELPGQFPARPAAACAPGRCAPGHSRRPVAHPSASRLDGLHLRRQPVVQRRRQHDHAVFVPLGCADDDLAPPRSISRTRRVQTSLTRIPVPYSNSMGRRKLESSGMAAITRCTSCGREHRGDAFEAAAALQKELPQVVRWDNVLQHLAVEEDQGAQRLVLCRGRETLADDQVVEERFDVGGAELDGVLPAAVRRQR